MASCFLRASMFGLRGDLGIAVRLFLILFLLVAANVAARTSRDAFLLEGRFASALPWLISATAVIMYLVVQLQSWLGTAGKSRRLFLATALVGGTSYFPFLPLSMAGADTLVYYAWTEALNSLLAVQFWILASQALDARRAKKLFGVIGAGGAIGGLVAGVLLRQVIGYWGATALIAISGVATAAAAALSFGIRLSEESEPCKDLYHESKWNLNHPYVRVLAALVIPGTLVATFVDYQFKIVAASSMPDKDALSVFFSTYHAVVSAATLFFQVFVTSFALTRLGLMFSLLVLPVALLILSAFVPVLAYSGTGAATALLYVTSAVRLTDQTVKFTINHAAFQLLWLPVPGLYKAKLKLDLEAVLRNGASGLAGLGIGALAAIVNPLGTSLPLMNTIIAIATGVLAMLWTLAAFRARSGYRTYLARSLENRLVDFSTDSLEIQSPEIRESLTRALASSEEGAVAFGLDVLQSQSLSGWEADLEARFGDTSALIRSRILELATRHETLLSRETLTSLAQSNDPLKYRAQVIAAQRRYREIDPQLTEQSNDPGYAGAIALGCQVLLYNSQHAIQELQRRLAAPDRAQRISVLNAARLFPGYVDRDALASALRENDAALRLAALHVAQQRHEPALYPEILLSLGEPRTFEAARRCLEKLPETDFMQLVADHIDVVKTPPALIRGACRIISLRGYAQGLPWLQKILALRIPETYLPAGEAIATLTARRTRIAEGLTDILVEDALRLYDHATHTLQIAHVPVPGGAVLGEWLTGLKRRFIRLACGYVGAAAGMRSIDTLFDGNGLKPQSRSRMLELVESSLKPEIRVRLVGLLEVSDNANSPARLSTEETAGLYTSWLQSASPWAQAMAALLLCHLPEPELRRELLGLWAYYPLTAEIIHDSVSRDPASWLRAIDSQELAGLSNKTAHKDGSIMYPTLEKILLLKSVSMFKDIPVEDISDLIQVSHEREFAGGVTLFHEGDEGDQLFIVITGQIRIHRDGHELALLKRGDFLGEMALLDDEPRSADATTVGECKMLSIGRQDFIDVLSSRPEVLKGILRLLSHRLREAISRQIA